MTQLEQKCSQQCEGTCPKKNICVIFLTKKIKFEEEKQSGESVEIHIIAYATYRVVFVRWSHCFAKDVK